MPGSIEERVGGKRRRKKSVIKTLRKIKKIAKIKDSIYELENKAEDMSQNIEQNDKMIENIRKDNEGFLTT